MTEFINAETPLTVPVWDVSGVGAFFYMLKSAILSDRVQNCADGVVEAHQRGYPVAVPVIVELVNYKDIVLAKLGV